MTGLVSFLLDRTWRFWDALWAFIICCSVTAAVLAVIPVRAR